MSTFWHAQWAYESFKNSIKVATCKIKVRSFQGQMLSVWLSIRKLEAGLWREGILVGNYFWRKSPKLGEFCWRACSYILKMIFSYKTSFFLKAYFQSHVSRHWHQLDILHEWCLFGKGVNAVQSCFWVRPLRALRFKLLLPLKSGKERQRNAPSFKSFKETIANFEWELEKSSKVA